MKAIFQRVISGVFSRKSPESAQTADSLGADRTGPGTVGPGTAPSQTRIDESIAALARRPLIAPSGDIVGFEFRAGPELQRRMAERDNPAAQAAHACALLGSAQWIARNSRTGLARVPADWLAHVAVLDIGPGTMVALEHTRGQPGAQLSATLEQAVAQMRAKGAKVGWEMLFGLELAPDFVLLRQGTDPMAALLEAARGWPAVRRGVPIVVTDISALAELELAVQGGAAMACSALTAAQLTNDQVPQRAVPPELRRIGQLLQLLSNGVDTATIVSDIKGDVGLSYRLLRRIQNARFAHLKQCASIEQAVLMLGRNELYRWLSLLMVQFAGTRPASSALQEVTLWRSRLLELLALRAAEPAPNQLFTLGLASMLGPLLGIGLPDVVELLNLPPSAASALIDHTGPWCAYLAVAEQVQNQSAGGDDTEFQTFGGWDHVLDLSAQAWDWAAENTIREEPESTPSAARRSA